MSWLGETTNHANPYGYLIGTGIFLGLLVVLVLESTIAALRRFVQRLALLVDHRRLDDGGHDHGGLLRPLARYRLCGRRPDAAGLGPGFAGDLVALGTDDLGVDTVSTPRVEVFYWVTITSFPDFGTALGDWMADDAGVGFLGGAGVFGAALAVVAALYFWTRISRVALFWVAFILTRPLGATLGDFLDKPHEHGGLALSRPVASLVIAAAMLALILVLPQRPGSHPRAPQAVAA